MEAANELKLALQTREVVAAGGKDRSEMSRILQTLGHGHCHPTPRQVIQKSASAAAMLEHGLTLLVIG